MGSRHESSNTLHLTFADPPLLHSVEEVQSLLRLRRTRLYELLATGELESVKVGRRRLITASALDRFVEGLERFAAASREGAPAGH